MKIRNIILIVVLSLCLMSCQKAKCYMLAVAGGEKTCEVSE